MELQNFKWFMSCVPYYLGPNLFIVIFAYSWGMFWILRSTYISQCLYSHLNQQKVREALVVRRELCNEEPDQEPNIEEIFV